MALAPQTETTGGAAPGVPPKIALRQVAKSYAKNEPVLDRKAKALTWAAGFATLEIVLLLAALWWAGRGP